MANIFDYLKWRSDVPFSVDPFGEVDNLVLAELSYTDFDKIVPSDSREISLRDAHAEFFRRHSRDEILTQTSFTAKAPLLMDEMILGGRFGNIKLSNYINEIDRSKDAQFSAVTLHLDDGTIYVSFRGTDGTIVGWKEDFNLSYISETEGQRKAVAYLNSIASECDCDIRVGGHSKGGNFAVYAATFCKDEAKSRITEIYSNDGPGFREEVTASPQYMSVLPKIISIVPETSVIGLLLSSVAVHRVVKSDASGIFQHDGFSWQVCKNRFEDAALSDMAIFIEKTLGTWLGEMDDETRKSMTASVFSLFEATGMDRFSIMSQKKWKSTEAIISSVYGLPKEKRRELIFLLNQLFKSGGQTAISGLQSMPEHSKN
jgi:hypothetical protein